jgi:hypothetical protein
VNRKLRLIVGIVALVVAAAIAVAALRKDVDVATYAFSKSTVLEEQDSIDMPTPFLKPADLAGSSIRVDYTEAIVQLLIPSREPSRLNVLSAGPHGSYDIVLVPKNDDALPHWVEQLLDNFDTKHIPEALWVKSDIHYIDDGKEHIQVLKLEYVRSKLQYSRNTPARLYRIAKSWVERLLFELEVLKNKNLLPQPPKDAREEQKPKISLVPGPNGLSEAKLNVYVGRSKVNLLSDKIGLVRTLLGTEQTDKPFGSGAGTSYYNILTSSGIEFIYEIHDGSLSRIIVESAAFPIEGGGRVGYSHNRILSEYPKGVQRRYKGPPQTESYLFVEMDRSGDIGVGFEFFFGKDDRVKTVTVGWQAFSQ